MVARNPHMARLKAGYLFPEINKRKRAFLEKNPQAQLISLGIGDTTLPLAQQITDGLTKAAWGLGTQEGYTGYSPEQGFIKLRREIAKKFYPPFITDDDIFISDGSKCDIGRLQQLFGAEVTIAVQDPAYPVYVDTSIITGQTGIVYMPCLPENGFFPNLDEVPRTDLIYFCSPNNPTGAVATRKQLEDLVAFAKKNKSIILFDAAYALYIRDPSLPKSIFEIPGAEEVAIELGSFSKMAGFTGVRLGWTAMSGKLVFDDGTPVKKDWHRIISTCFNGASNIAQHGGVSALSHEGMQEMHAMVDTYQHNADLLRELFIEQGYEVHGGVNAPYLWVKFEGWNSWDIFEALLERAHVVATPGSGFGPSGEGFLRFSAYAKPDQVVTAVARLKKLGNLNKTCAMH